MLTTRAVVLIADHLALPNLAGPLNALFGPTLSPDYPRFVPLSDAYDRRVRKAVMRSAYELAREGVFGPRPGESSVYSLSLLPLPCALSRILRVPSTAAASPLPLPTRPHSCHFCTPFHV